MKLQTAGALAGLMMVIGNAPAQTPPPPYPSKPIRLVVPYPPGAVVTRLHRETERIMKSDEMRQYVINQGAEAEAVGPADFAAAIKAETLRWGAVVKVSGAKVD